MTLAGRNRSPRCRQWVKHLAVVATLVIGVGLAACSQSVPSASGKSMADCPVTRPNGNTPPGEHPFPGNHGANDLWTTLWPDGTVGPPGAMVMPNGSVETVFYWTRGPQASGPLRVEGHRIDGNASPLRADVSPYYGDTVGYQPVRLVFPTPGCWEITAMSGRVALSIVQRVVDGPVSTAAP